MTRGRKILLISGATVLTLVGGCYLMLIAPLRSLRAERDGWSRDVRTPFGGCTACRGALRRFEVNGCSLPAPRLPAADPENGLPQVQLHTPVGWFMWSRREHNWRFYSDTTNWADSQTEISEEELRRGHYIPPPDSDHHEHRQLARKAGTPKSWCLIIVNDQGQWCDPMLLDKLEW